MDDQTEGGAIREESMLKVIERWDDQTEGGAIRKESMLKWSSVVLSLTVFVGKFMICSII